MLTAVTYSVVSFFDVYKQTMIDKSLHVVKSKKFLESLYSYQVVPVGLCTKKSPCFPIS